MEDSFEGKEMDCINGAYIERLIVNGCRKHSKGFFEYFLNIKGKTRFLPEIGENYVYKFAARYSDLAALHAELLNEFKCISNRGAESHFPIFPPKCSMTFKTNTFIKKRKEDLETYFNNLFLIFGPRIYCSLALNSFFAPHSVEIVGVGPRELTLQVLKGIIGHSKLEIKSDPNRQYKKDIQFFSSRNLQIGEKEEGKEKRNSFDFGALVAVSKGIEEKEGIIEENAALAIDVDKGDISWSELELEELAPFDYIYEEKVYRIEMDNLETRNITRKLMSSMMQRNTCFLLVFNNAESYHESRRFLQSLRLIKAKTTGVAPIFTLVKIVNPISGEISEQYPTHIQVLEDISKLFSKRNSYKYTQLNIAAHKNIHRLFSGVLGKLLTTYQSIEGTNKNTVENRNTY